MTFSRRYRPVLLGMLTWSAISVFLAPQAKSQLFSPDPYDPYGRAYRSFAYPNAGDNPSLPNATRYAQGPAATASRANQFEGFMNDPTMTGFGGRSSRYDSAFRRIDRDLGRQPTDAEATDAKYFQAREKREQALLRAMLERDPKKREELVRTAEKEAADSGGLLGPSSRRRSGTSTIPPSPRLKPKKPVSGASSARIRPAPRGAKPPASTSGTPASGSTSTPPPPPAVRPARKPATSPRPRTPSEILERNRAIDGGVGSGTSENRGALPPKD